MCATLSSPVPQSTLDFSVAGTSSAMESIDAEKANSDEKDNGRGVPNAWSFPFLPKIGQNNSIQQQQQQQVPRYWSFSRITCLRRRRALRSSDSFSADAQYQAIQRALLLNAYPVAYIILLLPGLANRLVEATGHTSQVAQLLQASTQLVGLANALTYGWNERVAKQLKEQFVQRGWGAC